MQQRTHQWNDDFAVGVCLELDIWANASTKGNVIVNFSVNSKDHLAIFANQRLSTGVCRKLITGLN